MYMYMQQPYMISAVHELVEKETYTGHHHRCVAEYLEACHKLFEEGILSHKTVSSTDKQVLVNMDKGFQFFQQWKDELSGKYPGVHYVLYRVTYSVMNLFYGYRCEVEESTTKEFPCLASM